MNEHEQLVDQAARHARTALFLGGLDSGKSTLARATAAFALRLGRTVAYLDADVAQKTVGPPATVGMKHIRVPDDLTLERMAEADALGFVGSTSPQDHLVPLVGALQRLKDRARTEGADLLIVDTGGEVSGIRGQLVKYYKVDALQPDLVVALQRGEELEPILGVVDRFFGIESVRAPVHPGVQPTSVEERMAMREKAMARYFDSAPLQRFRVRPTVFMPTLPPLFDLQTLDRLLVGLSDGHGGFTGLGVLEHVPEDGGLRLISPVAEPPKALRLGSVRLEDSYRAKRVDLRNLFGTE
ncbi:MAG TPA: polynucleotide 5'-hydroxyl-kinase [Actinomycetota bacterium]|nr:polynucleotide 5'-hydroxyl-kinase [Actinomycetota bacterium]